MSVIVFSLYILIGSIFIWLFMRYSDAEIADAKDFSLCVVLICLWPAILVCGIILTIMDWLDGFGGGSGLFV